GAGRVSSSRLRHDIHALDVDQLARSRTGIVAGHRGVPVPAAWAAGVDQEAFEADHLAGAHAFQLSFHAGIGGDHVHVGAGGLDLAARDRELLHVPIVEAPGLADVDMCQHAAVGHAAPAEGEVQRHQVGAFAPRVVLAREHAGGDVEVRAGGEGGVAFLQPGAVIEVDLDGRLGGEHAGPRLHGAVLAM